MPVGGAAVGGWLARGAAARSFPCALCGKTFALRTSLTHHMGLHRGETRCPVCHRVFSRKGHMLNHLRTVHQVT